MRNLLLVIVLIFQSGVAVAIGDCKTLQGIESGVILTFKGEAKQGRSSYARYRIENQSALPITVWVLEFDDLIYFSGASVGYQYPDINGAWVHHIHSVGSEFEARPHTIKSNETVELNYVLPAESALRFAGGMARLVVKFVENDSCVYSTTLKAKFSKSKFEGIERPGR